MPCFLKFYLGQKNMEKKVLIMILGLGSDFKGLADVNIAEPTRNAKGVMQRRRGMSTTATRAT